MAGILYWGLQVPSSFSIWGCILKDCFERCIFWRAISCLKGIEDFNLEHWSQHSQKRQVFEVAAPCIFQRNIPTFQFECERYSVEYNQSHRTLLWIVLRGIFWRATLRLKDIEGFNLEHRMEAFWWFCIAAHTYYRWWYVSYNMHALFSTAHS